MVQVGRNGRIQAEEAPDGNGPVTPIVEKIHFCPTCDATTVWCRDTKDPTKAFCCKCGEVEELAAEALLD
jgi:hypothetical protein